MFDGQRQRQREHDLDWRDRVWVIFGLVVMVLVVAFLAGVVVALWGSIL